MTVLSIQPPDSASLRAPVLDLFSGVPSVAARDLTEDCNALQSSDLCTRGPRGGRAARSSLRMRIGRVLAPLLLTTLVACAKPANGPIVTVHAASGDARVSVELAMTREEQARGLMYRTELEEGTGMLFVFDDESERTFWMSNTPIALDILYIRGDATIGSIASNTTPYSEKTIPSRGPARYVLEVPGGWSQRHGVKTGDRVTLPDLAHAGRPGD
jgi:uncharacterized protein